MSILIKGMEMPKDRAVYIAIDNGEVFVKPLGALHWTHLDEHAIELPPHGRLIDADELCKTLRSLAENEYTPEVFANWIENHIDTIIPAEEVET